MIWVIFSKVPYIEVPISRAIHFDFFFEIIM